MCKVVKLLASGSLAAAVVFGFAGEAYATFPTNAVGASVEVARRHTRADGASSTNSRAVASVNSSANDPSSTTATSLKNEKKGAAAPTVVLGTVEVTATRRLEPIQSVPGSVTSLNGSFLQQIHASNLEQFAPFVPGLSFNSLGPTSDLIALRGVTTGGTQLSSGIGMYLGQVPIGASTSFGLGFQTVPINTFDLSRVEVLNGPQGTLYGANALGGAIKYVPTPPNLNAFGGTASLSVDDMDHAGTGGGAEVMVNQPLASGQAALRIDGVQQYQPGWGKNTLMGTDNEGASHMTMGRAQLLWQFNPDLSVKFSAFWQRDAGNGLNVDFRNIATGQPVIGTYDQEFALNQTELNTLSMASAIVDWNLHWADFTSITAHQNNNGNSFEDLSDLYNVVFHNDFGFPLSVYGFRTDTSTNKWTQEFRLVSPRSQRFEWLLGTFAAHEETDEFVNLQNSEDPAGLLVGFSPFFGILPSLYQELSVFGDGTYHFTNKFDLTLGARHSWNYQHYQQFANGWLVVPVDPGLTTHENATSRQGVTTYLLNPKYQVSKNFMVYGKVASGYRPGGPNFVLQLGKGEPTFQPDKLWNYELGEKATLLGGRATLDVDAYDIDWQKIQLTVNNGGVNQLENGGDARIKGAEISGAYKVTPRLKLLASAAYTDARLDSAVPALGLTEPDSRLPFSPRYNIAVGASYNFSMGNDASGLLTVTDAYIGDRTAGYDGSEIAPGYDLPGYNTLNLDFALFMPSGLEIDMFMRNAFDRVGQISATTIANEYDPTAPVPVVLSQPRTLGVQVTLPFGNPD